MNLTRKIFQVILGLGILSITSGSVQAQIMPSGSQQAPQATTGDPRLQSLPINASLYHSAVIFKELDLANILSSQDFPGYFDKRGLLVDERARVLVEISGPKGGIPVSVELIEQFGGLSTGGWRHLTEALLPLDTVIEFTKNLPSGYSISSVESVNHNDVVGQGSIATGSDSYRDNGADCSGMVIGVIDFGYEQLTAAINNSDLPPVGSRLVQVNLSSNSNFESSGVHGTAVAETVYDHCPGANYRLYKIDYTHSDFATAIADANANGVDVIAHAISWYNTGWEDNSGNICDAVFTLGETLFFNSAGNRAESHWQGMFNDPDNDGWHNWPNGSELLDMAIRSSTSNGFVSTYLSWDLSGGDANYDIYLYDSSLTELARADSGGNSYEKLYLANTETATTWHLAIRRVSGMAAELELFDHNGGNWNAAYEMAENSTDSPSNCTFANNIIVIGAVNWAVYGNTNPEIESYSSRGPTNDGANVLDLVAPTNTNTFAYQGSFGGTSCATPNAAGTAAAFWDDQDQYTTVYVRWLLKRQSSILKDWGTGSYDHIFGDGGIVLHPWAMDTVWVDRDAYNWDGNPDVPYYYLSDAQNNAVAGGRIVFISGNYPEAITLNKQLRYENIGGTAKAGE